MILQILYLQDIICPQGLFLSPQNVHKMFVSPSICPQGLFRPPKMFLKIMYLQAYARSLILYPKIALIIFKLCISKQVPAGAFLYPKTSLSKKCLKTIWIRREGYEKVKKTLYRSVSRVTKYCKKHIKCSFFHAASARFGKVRQGADPADEANCSSDPTEHTRRGLGWR